MPKRELNLLLTLLVFLGFVSIGLSDGLTGVAWPSMRGYFGLPIDALGGLLVSYTAGYLVSSFGSGRPLARIGVGALLALRRWIGAYQVDGPSSPEPVVAATNASTLRLLVVWFSAAIFFVYTGIEAAMGAWAYSLLTESRAIPMMTAGTWVSVYWGALTVGRILSATIAGRASVDRLLRGCISGQAVGALLVWFDFSVSSSFLGLALIGLASAPIFPTMIASTPDHITRNHLANAVGFQIAAAVLGQSLLPAPVGVMARRLGLEVVAPALVAAALLLYSLHEAMTTIRAKASRKSPVAT